MENIQTVTETATETVSEPEPFVNANILDVNRQIQIVDIIDYGKCVGHFPCRHLIKALLVGGETTDIDLSGFEIQALHSKLHAHAPLPDHFKSMASFYCCGTQPEPTNYHNIKFDESEKSIDESADQF